MKIKTVRRKCNKKRKEDEMKIKTVRRSNQTRKEDKMFQEMTSFEFGTRMRCLLLHPIMW